MEVLARRLPVASIILAFVIGVCAGSVMVMAIDVLDQPCDSGQVYVIDTERCVSASDHLSHSEGN